MTIRSILAVSGLLAVLGAQQPAGRGAPGKPPTPPLPVLGQGATATLVHSFTTADSWAMQAIVLLSLGHDWHPDGVEIVLTALRGKDERLRPYGIEVLRRMDPRALAKVASADLVTELIEKTLRHKNKLLQERTLEVLARLFPDVTAKDRAAWSSWWGAAQKAYAPPAWVAPEQPKGDGKGGNTVVATIVERAFDLRDAGLDLAIVIDSTGSMQMAIDLARDAIDDVVAMLASLAPKLRLGLVHYKDFDDFKDGAQLLVPLTKDQKQVRDRLAKLIAGGGGDIPERIEKGIEFALSKEMGWNKDANRMILVIGDAPPHAEAEAELLAMVKRAYEHPFAKGKNPTTGPAQKLRPFITSAIATSQAAKASFDAIAAAGGGTSVLLDGAAGGKRVDGKVIGGAPKSPVRQVVEHIMLLSFGSQYQAQLEVFVATFFDYRDAK